jgi:superoxide dismutase, Cu-Zn family
VSRIHLSVLVALLCLGALAAVALASGDRRGGHGDHDGRYAKATLRDADGKRVGRVVLAQRGDRAVVDVQAYKLAPGFHGFHVHETGVCEPPFESAGGHLALEGQVHDDHTGDLPVLQVGADGRAYQLTTTDRFRVGDLFDLDGSAVIVHANPDNFANIPERYRSANGQPGPDAETLEAGDSGARVACGVVR